jgi:hypothetical protein
LSGKKVLALPIKKTVHPKKKEKCLIYQESPDISEGGTFHSITPHRSFRSILQKIAAPKKNNRKDGIQELGRVVY